MKGIIKKPIIIIVTSKRTAVIPNLSYQTFICLPKKVVFFAIKITIKSIIITENIVDV